MGKRAHWRHLMGARRAAERDDSGCVMALGSSYRMTPAGRLCSVPSGDSLSKKQFDAFGIIELERLKFNDPSPVLSVPNDTSWTSLFEFFLEL